ncbi:MAG TPA: hypothetical protein VGA58_13705 [bacterium]
MLQGLPVIGQLVGGLIDTLKSVGILRTPEDELKAQQAMAAIVQAQWASITDFVKATTPDPTRVYIWVNSLIALVRPAVTILLITDIMTNPGHRLDMTDARMWPVLWWFFGAELLRFVGLRAPANGDAAPAPRGSSATLEAADRK